MEVEQMATEDKLRVLDGGTVAVKCKVKLSLQIGETEVNQQFWVAPVSNQCLLGRDFLRAHECLIDYKRMILSIDGADVPVESAESWTNL